MAHGIPGTVSAGVMGGLGGLGPGHATYKRLSSPRPRKAPGCTVLMTLFLRSLWKESGEALSLSASSQTPSPFAPLGPGSLPVTGSVRTQFPPKSRHSSVLMGKLDEGPAPHTGLCGLLPGTRGTWLGRGARV